MLADIIDRLELRGVLTVLVLLSLALCVGISGIYSALTEKLLESKLRDQGVSAEGKIMWMAKVGGQRGISKFIVTPTCKVEFRYKLQDTTFTKTVCVVSEPFYDNHHQGQRVPIRYWPSDPQQMVAVGGEPEGWANLPYSILTTLIAGGGLLSAYLWRKKLVLPFLS
jgi:hypothetical protein